MQQEPGVRLRSVGGLVSEIGDACAVWQQTLGHFKQARALIESERFAIGRAIQQHGFEAVKLALIGARYEPKSEKFDPSDWLSLERVLTAKNFTRFLGLGTKRSQVEPAPKRPTVDWGPLGPPEGSE